MTFKLSLRTALMGWIFLCLLPASPAKTHDNVLNLQAVVLPKEQFQYQGQGEVGGSQDFAGWSELACTVKNVSAAPVIICTSTQAWSDNWSVDGPVVEVPHWPTSANGIVVITLAPGEIYAKVVPIGFAYGKAGRKFTFRVRFENDPGHCLQEIPEPNHKAAKSYSYSVLSAPVTMRVPERIKPSQEPIQDDIAPEYP